MLCVCLCEKKIELLLPTVRHFGKLSLWALAFYSYDQAYGNMDLRFGEFLVIDETIHYKILFRKLRQYNGGIRGATEDFMCFPRSWKEGWCNLMPVHQRNLYSFHSDCGWPSRMIRKVNWPIVLTSDWIDPMSIQSDFYPFQPKKSNFFSPPAETHLK